MRRRPWWDLWSGVLLAGSVTGLLLGPISDKLGWLLRGVIVGATLTVIVAHVALRRARTFRDRDGRRQS